MSFQEYEDEIPYVEWKSSPGEINSAQKSAPESFPTEDRRGSHNGGRQLVKQPLSGKSAIPLMISGFCILACSVSLWLGIIFFPHDTNVADVDFLVGLPLISPLGAALLLIGLALRLKPAYSKVYRLSVSGAITLVLGLESLVEWIRPETLRSVFYISDLPETLRSAFYLSELPPPADPLSDPRWFVPTLLIFGVAIVLIVLTLMLKPGHILAYGFGISGEVMLAFSLIAWLTTLNLGVSGQGESGLFWILAYDDVFYTPIFVVVGAVLLGSSLWVFVGNVLRKGRSG